MKKRNFLLIFAIFSFSPIFADKFTDLLQDLAAQTACVGQYSATQAGGGWTDDPHDYYTPKLMADRFKEMSGNMTRTTTFYGVCFDYAEYAYRDIEKYKSTYNKAGMFEDQFWLAGANSNPNVITLSNPTSQEDATAIQNGVYVKTYDSSEQNVKTHKMTSGERATHHAWLWVERADGVWFWLDPTWTDNLGYIVYGYVDGNEEIQCKPDEKYCIEYPEYLKNLPSPPSFGKSKDSSGKENSFGDSSSTKSISDSSISGKADSESSFAKYSTFKKYKSKGFSVTIPFKTLFDEFFSFNDFGVSFDVIHLTGPLSLLYSIEFLRNGNDADNRNALLLSGGLGWRPYNNLALFADLGFGAATEDFEKLLFVYKIGTGAIVHFSPIFAKFELSYNNVSEKASLGIGFGWGHEK